MNLDSFVSLFKKKKQTLKSPQSLLIKKLKTLSNLNNLFIFENITIYHKSNNLFIPLLILDTTKGLYLFEYKEWSYDDLKNSTISRATNQTSSTKTLSYQNAHSFIEMKFEEFINSKDIPIYNFLLMPNLNTDEYEHLDTSFKKLLPNDKIIFNDSDDNIILKKLSHNIEKKQIEFIDIINILLPQYLNIGKNNNFYISTDEQISFINQELDSEIILNAKEASGKTNSILQKAIFEKIKNPNYKIIIIQITVIACNKLKLKLENSMKNFIFDFDINDIEIITPIDLVNKHLKKLEKNQLEVILHIDKKLMKNNFYIADLILCDDSDMLSYQFILYLQHLQKKHYLILVQNHPDESNNKNLYHFNKNFRSINQKILFKKANPYVKTLEIVTELLKENQSNDIIIICDNYSKKKLQEDLKHFIRDDTIPLDGLLLLSYKQIASMESKFVILLDTDSFPQNEVNYALNLSTDSSFIIFEEESNEIKQLKVKYAK